MDNWGGTHHCKCPLETLVGMREFKNWIATETPKVKEDFRFVDKLIIDANTISEFDWKKSEYPTFEARQDLNPKVIAYFIAGLESHGHSGKYDHFDGPEIYDWYDRLLKVEGLSEAIKIPALIGYLLYFEANEGWSDQDELEKIYSLRKQLLDFPSQAGFHNYISAANTCRELKK